MKTTIILILALVCQVMNGQITKEMETWFDSTSYHIEGYEELGDFTNKEYIELKAAKLLVTAWDEYSKECYADSVGTCMATFSSTFSGIRMPCDKVHPMDEKFMTKQWTYTHREPTLPGFMAYLKRKYRIQ